MRSFLVMSDLTKRRSVPRWNLCGPDPGVWYVNGVFNGTATAAAFYELTFIILYLVQWLLLSVLLPLVQIMIVFAL